MWRVTIAAGAVWVVVTLWLTLMLFMGASEAAEDGLIVEPTGSQALVAALSAVIFGTPGVALIVYGWSRRRR